MPWKDDDGFLFLTTPSGDGGEMLMLWAFQRGHTGKWSAGIDDGQTQTLESKWDHFDTPERAQHFALIRGLEWLKKGIAELSQELDALDKPSSLRAIDEQGQPLVSEDFILQEREQGDGP